MKGKVIGFTMSLVTLVLMVQFVLKFVFSIIHCLPVA
jgi:hypothetical protein